jgi:hypothetical protein
MTKSQLVALVIGLVGLVLFLGGGLVVAFLGPEPAANVEQRPVVEVAEPDVAGPSPARVKELARSLVAQKQWQAAVSVLDLMGPAGDAETQSLRMRAMDEMENQRPWEQACTLGEAGDLRAVHRACSRIEAGSVYHEQGCCEGSGRRYGREQIARASELLGEGDRAAAETLARGLAADGAVPEDIRAEAETIAQRAAAGREIATAAASPQEAAVARAPSAGPGAGRSLTKVDENAAWEEARSAVLSGDQQGCIRALRAAPRTRRVVNGLLGCYYEAGQISEACRLGRSHENLLNDRTRQLVTMRCQ